MKSTGLQVERIESFDSFNDLEWEWNSLAKDHVDTIFLTHGWLSEWWQVFNSDYRLMTLVARKDGALVGILPLMLQHHPGRFRRLSFMGAGDVTPNHLDAITLPEIRAEVVSAFAAYLDHVRSEWDVLELDKIPADSCTAGIFSAYLRSQGFSLKTEVVARCPYAEVPGSFDMYMKSRSHNTRDTYRRAKRALRRDFPGASLKCVQTQEELDFVMEKLIAMHQKRWTQRGYPGAFADERMVVFHHRMASRALRDGNLRFYYLQIDADIIAARYCYQVAQCFQFYLTSFDERYSKYSPGHLLLAYAAEQSILEGAQRLDFLEGEEEHKAKWMTGARENLRLQVFSPNWHGILAQASNRITTTLMDFSLKYVPVGIRRPLWQLFLHRKAARQRASRPLSD